MNQPSTLSTAHKSHYFDASNALISTIFKDKETITDFEAHKLYEIYNTIYEGYVTFNKETKINIRAHVGSVTGNIKVVFLCDTKIYSQLLLQSDAARSCRIYTESVTKKRIYY